MRRHWISRRAAWPIARGPLPGALMAAILALPAAGAEGPIFIDRAAESGLDFVHFNGMSGELYFAENMGAGAALFDYDGDGDLDAYLAQGHMLGPGKTAAEATFPPRHPLPLTDRLYRNDSFLRPDGSLELRFSDVTGASGIRAEGYGMGVATGDFDNDGWIDLYVTNFGANQLWRNNGDGTFTEVTEETGAGDPRWSVSAAFLDYDRDGWLDLYVGNYVSYTVSPNRVCTAKSGARDYCGPLAFEPEPDRLLRNRGDGTFEDASSRAGIAGEKGSALGVLAADFNGDGWPDVYVANDLMPNRLWLNQGDGTFRDDGLLSGTSVDRAGQVQASMGVDAGDFDGDGDEDLFMAHLTGEMNTLYVNDGGALFRDRSLESGLGTPSWNFTGFGTAWFDYDNDGWLDVLVVNGAVKIIEALARRGDPYPLHQTNQLFRNLGGEGFRDATGEAGPAFSLSEVSRGAAFGDLDNDGDGDVLVTNNAGPARLLINQVGQEAAWVGLRLLAGDPPRDALGARIAATPAGAPPRWRRARTDSSYASANDPRIAVGLGEGKAERIRIHWLEGGARELEAPPAGRYLVVFREAP